MKPESFIGDLSPREVEGYDEHLENKVIEIDRVVNRMMDKTRNLLDQVNRAVSETKRHHGGFGSAEKFGDSHEFKEVLLNCSRIDDNTEHIIGYTRQLKQGEYSFALFEKYKNKVECLIDDNRSLLFNLRKMVDNLYHHVLTKQRQVIEYYRGDDGGPDAQFLKNFGEYLRDIYKQSQYLANDCVHFKNELTMNDKPKVLVREIDPRREVGKDEIIENADLSSVPDYSKIPSAGAPERSSGVGMDEREAVRDLWEKLETQRAKEIDDMMNEYSRLDDKLFDALSNGEKVEIQGKIAAMEDKFARFGYEEVDETTGIKKGKENQSSSPMEDLKRLRRNRNELLDEISYRSLQLQRMPSDDQRVEILRKEQDVFRARLSKVEDQMYDLEKNELPYDKSTSIQSIYDESHQVDEEMEDLNNSEQRKSDTNVILGRQSAPEVIDLDSSQWREVKNDEIESQDTSERVDVEVHAPTPADQNLHYATEARSVIDPVVVPSWMEQLSRQVTHGEYNKSATDKENASGDGMETGVRVEVGGVVPVLEDKSAPAEVPPAEAERSEHWQLKRAMREAKSEYLAKLEESVKQRGALQKMLGFGRRKLDADVQSAYDAFMLANKAYYQHAEQSGRYAKIDAWLRKRQRSAEGAKEVVGVYGAVAERHVFAPARERLALQEREMPLAVRKLFGEIAARPKLKMFLLGASAVSTLGGSIVGMYAGKFTKWGLEKTYVKSKERDRQLDQNEIIEMLASGRRFDLNALEDIYFDSALAVDTARARATAAGVVAGAAVTAGAGYTIGNELFSQTGGLTVDPEQVDLGRVDLVEIPPSAEPTVPEVSTKGADQGVATPREAVDRVAAGTENGAEKIVTVKSGDTVSNILYEGLKERIATGQIKLPPNVTPDTLSHHLYQSLPELTNASDVASRLTPQEWIKLGISSGDPQHIMAGETINVEAILDKLSSQSVQSVDVIPHPVTGTEAVGTEITNSVTIGDQDIAATDGGLTDSLTTESPAQTSSAVETATTSEQVVLQKMAIAKNGQVQLLTPEVVGKLVSPFNAEVPHVMKSYENLLDVMVDRLEAGVKAGQVNLDPTMSKVDLRNLLLDRFQELKQPDEVLWFQRTASPGLSAETWHKIGIPNGDPLDIPVGTKIDMKLLLNKAFGFETDAAGQIIKLQPR